MFIAQVNFTTNIEDRAVLYNNARHAKNDFAGYNGLIEVEFGKMKRNL